MFSCPRSGANDEEGSDPTRRLAELELDGLGGERAEIRVAGAVIG